jgi:thiol-disulfide isomerase/thioredoxin
MPEAFTIGPLLFPTRPAAVILSLLLAIWLCGRLATRTELDVGWARHVAEWSGWLGILGARLGYVIVNWSAFRAEPWIALYLWQPGYLPYTGVILGSAYAVWRLGKRSLPERWSYLRAVGGGYAAGGLLAVSVLATMNAFTAPGVLRAGDRVPEFTLMDLEGRKVRFSDLDGQAVVLNFWATWCPPCRREMPLLDAIYKEYEPRGLVVVGVDLGEPIDTVKSFIKDMGVRYPIWVDPPFHDPGFDRTRQIYKRFGGIGLPTTLFIYPNGIVQGVHVGELNRAILQQRAAELLGK